MKFLNAKRSTLNPKVKRKQPPWNWFEALLLGLLSLLGADVIVGIGFAIGAQFFGTTLSQLTDGSLFFNFAIYATSRLLGLLVVYLFIHRRKVSIRQFGLKGFKVWPAVWYLFIASTVLLAGTVLLFLIIQQVAPGINLEETQNIVFTQAQSKPEIIMAFIALVIIAPFVEEVIFRGLMLPVFVYRFGLPAGIIITSVLFGAIHYPPFNAALVTALMGVLLAWLYYKTRSLWPAIIFHSLKNLVAFMLIFFT